MIGNRLSAITLMLTDVKDGHEFARTHRGIHREVVEWFLNQKIAVGISGKGPETPKNAKKPSLND